MQLAALAAVIGLPADTFAADRAPAVGARRTLQQAGGALLVVVGLFLSLPGVVGPGLLVVGAGVVLLSRDRLRRIPGFDAALRHANAVRARFGRPPFDP